MRVTTPTLIIGYDLGVGSLHMTTLPAQSQLCLAVHWLLIKRISVNVGISSIFSPWSSPYGSAQGFFAVLLAIMSDEAT